MGNIRRLHAKVSVIIFVPLLIIVLTGVILQLRQQFNIIQPKTSRLPLQAFDQVIAPGKILEKHNLKSQEVSQFIFKPKHFIYLIRFKDGMQWQVHPLTNEVIKKSKRYTGVLIELHQGSFFGRWYMYFIALTSSLGLLFLMYTGMKIYLRKYNWRTK